MYRRDTVLVQLAVSPLDKFSVTATKKLNISLCISPCECRILKYNIGQRLHQILNFSAEKVGAYGDLNSSQIVHDDIEAMVPQYMKALCMIVSFARGAYGNIA